MKLIWTFNSKGGNSIVRLDNKKITIINYYIYSILCANKLGYETIIYTNEPTYFYNIADEVIPIEIIEDSSVWVNLKLDVLENRNDDFCLVDPDLILTKKLPTIEDGIMFDTYEMGNWDREYSKQVNQLTDLGIGTYLDFWESAKRPVINCGIMYIKSSLLKSEYVKAWREYRKWLYENINDKLIDIDSAQMIGEQYILTLVVEKLNIQKHPVNNYMGEVGKYYTHHFGVRKYTNPIVSTTTLISNVINEKKVM